MLASMSTVVRVGFQPMARDRLARQREFVARAATIIYNKKNLSTSGPAPMNTYTHPEVLADLFVGESRWLRMFSSAQFHKGLGDSLAKVIQGMFAVLPEVISFTAMSDVWIGLDCVEENGIEISNCTQIR
jgi:hypothetical protein